jgi:non-ribosomal peptide synthase protein (TIGR01720 family)
VEGHGRGQDLLPGADLSRTLGWFTTVHPVFLGTGGADAAEALAGGPAAGHLVKTVKEWLRAVPDDGIGHGLLRRFAPEGTVLADGRRPGLGFNFLGRFTAGPDGHWAPLPGAADPAGQDPATPLAHVVDLDAAVRVGPEGPVLVARWTWARRLLDDEDARRLAGLWFTAIEALAEHTRLVGHVGVTPSDVALASIGQAEIDAFERELDAELGAGGDDEWRP